MAPARHLEPQGPHSVAGPSGPGFLRPPTSLRDASHQPQRQLPPSQDRLWAARPPSVSWTLPQLSHTKPPASFLVGGPVAPPLNLPPQGPHRVAGPLGPGFFLLPASLIVQEHQSQRHEPPSQKRRWPDNAPIESNREPQPSHLNLPVSGHFDGALLAPPRNLPPQAAHNVAGPFGPGARPDVSSLLQPHQSQLHLPPSQKRRWPDNAEFVGNFASHESQRKLPSASRFGGPVAPCRYRPPQGPHKVAGPFGPGFLRCPLSFEEAPHQPQRHVPPSQWRLCGKQPVNSTPSSRRSHG